MDINLTSAPILVGDIGGTNSRLEIARIFKNKSKDSISIHTQVLSSQSFPDIISLFREFLKNFEGTENYPQFCVIGLPGPVQDNKIEVISNLKWGKVWGDEISKELGFKKTVLLNDFVANGYGLLANIKEGVDYIKINDAEVIDNAPILMVGAGTGMGHGYLAKNSTSKYHEVYPSEGGHQSFAPNNQEEWEYKQFLQKKSGEEFVAVEHSICGPGIKNMFHFYVEEKGMKSDLLKDKKIEEITNKDIIDAGTEKKCDTCVKIIQLFNSIYGSVCGSMSLLFLPYGGLYLLGGLSERLKDNIINDKEFIESYLAKGILRDFLKKFPIYIVLNTFIGVLGTKEYARRLYENDGN